MVSEIPNLYPALPEILLALAGMVLLMLGVFAKGDSARLVGNLGAAVMIVAAGLAIVFGGVRQVTFNGLFVTDSFAVYAKLMVLLSSAVTLLLAVKWMEQENIARFEYPILVVFAALGMCAMISANDFLSLYLGLETQSLALYLVAAFQRDTVRSTEAGLKYFVLGALASGLLLYGVSLVYGFAGSTNFDVLARGFASGEAVSPGVVVGLVFIICALAFKCSAVPFHMWTPDVYEGAPTPVTAFFSVAPKVAALALFLRVMISPFGDLLAQWQQVIIAIAILSMLVGGFAAIVQTNIKRLMAYSSIGHVGYALIGLAVGNEAGVSAVLIYLAIYLFMNIGTFAVILSMRANGRMVEGIGDLAGLSKNRPIMAAALAVMMFSMAGVPPFAGFFGKFFIFKAAVDAGLIPLAVVGVLTSVVAAFYYLRIIKVVYFDDPADQFEPMPAQARLVLGITSVAVVIFFLFPLPQVLVAAGNAARALFGA
jgi:NADH-quinone oxidoreductase subunit N